MSVAPLKPDRIANNNFAFATNNESGIVATAGGVQATAYQMGAQRNYIATCATDGDSVALPKIVNQPNRLDKQGCSPGSIIFVINRGAAACQVFGGTNALDTINGAATATGISLAANTGGVFIAGPLSSLNVGNWMGLFNVAGSGTFTSIVANDITGGDSSLGILGQSTAQGGAVALVGGTSSTSGNAGGAVTLTGGTPGLTGVGGAVTLTGAAGGATSGAGGAVSLTGGAGTAGNAVGGAVTLTGGAGQGSQNGGALTLTSGAAGATGVAGAVAIAVGAATAGAGSNVTITGGDGAGGTAAGGNVNLVPGTAVSTGVPGEVQVNGNSATMEIPVFFSATDVSRRVFIATRACRLKACSSAFATASSSGTWTVEKTPSGTAAGSGTALLTGAINLSGTANTPANGTLIATVASLTLAAGDSLSIVVAGTMTNLVGGVGTIMVTPC